MLCEGLQAIVQRTDSDLPDKFGAQCCTNADGERPLAALANLMVRVTHCIIRELHCNPPLCRNSFFSEEFLRKMPVIHCMPSYPYLVRSPSPWLQEPCMQEPVNIEFETQYFVSFTECSNTDSYVLQ